MKNTVLYKKLFIGFFFIIFILNITVSVLQYKKSILNVLVSDIKNKSVIDTHQNNVNTIITVQPHSNDIVLVNKPSIPTNINSKPPENNNLKPPENNNPKPPENSNPKPPENSNSKPPLENKSAGSIFDIYIKSDSSNTNIKVIINGKSISINQNIQSNKYSKLYLKYDNVILKDSKIEVLNLSENNIFIKYIKIDNKIYKPTNWKNTIDNSVVNGSEKIEPNEKIYFYSKDLIDNMFGMNINIDENDVDPSIEDLKNLGIKWVRVEWNYKFEEKYIPKFSEYKKNGINVLLIVDYFSFPNYFEREPWLHRDDNSLWNQIRYDYITKLDEISNRINNAKLDNITYQIWNEMDIKSELSRIRIEPYLYGKFLKEASNTLLKNSIYSNFVTGSFVSGDETYLHQAVDSAGGSLIDLGYSAISVHPYGRRAPDNWPNKDYGFGNLSDYMNWIYEISLDKKYNWSLPLWITELGEVNPDLQAQYTYNIYEEIISNHYGNGEGKSFVPIVFYFCYTDKMVEPFGLRKFGTNGLNGIKDSYIYYKNVMRYIKLNKNNFF